MQINSVCERSVNYREGRGLALPAGQLGGLLLVTLLLPIVLLVVGAANFIDASEINEPYANISSSLLALACWAVAGRILFVRIFGKQFFLLLTVLASVKVTANFLHFYFIFAPAAGIDSSGALLQADFSGDLGAIFNSATVFVTSLEEHGLYYAVFGDYYRAINNPGVGIIYGGLFSIFGAYGTVAIPWAVLYSAFASIVIGLIGRSQRLPANLCRTGMLLVFLMPGFFIFPPLYRDNFIVFLLVLSAYAAILAPRGKVGLCSVVLSLLSILLFSLRAAYLPVPFIFAGIAMYLRAGYRVGLTGRRIAFGVILLLLILVGWSFLAQYLDVFDRIVAASESDESNFSTLLAFKALGPVFFYPAAAMFTLLAPMPWWQSVSPSILSYQVLAYAQTWYAMTALFALYGTYRRNMLYPGGSVLIACFLVMFVMVVLGSLNLSALYFQVALPFVLLASTPYLSVNWVTCFAVSTTIIGLVHIFIFDSLIA